MGVSRLNFCQQRGSTPDHAPTEKELLSTNANPLYTRTHAHTHTQTPKSLLRLLCVLGGQWSITAMLPEIQNLSWGIKCLVKGAQGTGGFRSGCTRVEFLNNCSVEFAKTGAHRVQWKSNGMGFLDYSSKLVLYSWWCYPIVLKGIVHRKMRMYPLSTHHNADGGVGEVFESTKHFWSFRGKFCCSQIQYNWSKWWLLLIVKKWNCNMPPYGSCGIIQVSGSPDIQIQSEEDIRRHLG